MGKEGRERKGEKGRSSARLLFRCFRRLWRSHYTWRTNDRFETTRPKRM